MTPAPLPSPRHARISWRSPSSVSIEVGGVDLASAVRGLRLVMGAGSVPVLTLDLLVWEESEVEVEARVTVPERTAEALVALGWTPPSDKDEVPRD